MEYTNAPTGSSSAERSSIAQKIVECQLGELAYDQLSDSQKTLVDTFVLGGCCAHKDLNTFRYGCKAMHDGWPKGETPILLANKANDAVIKLGKDADSAAVQNAIASSTRGVVKSTSLMGMLFRHKEENKGYQAKYTMFLETHKDQLYDKKDAKNFPNTSAIRYQSYSYAAAVVTKYRSLLLQLINEICDAKVRGQQANHVEDLVRRALDCPRTQAETVTAALYGNSVSWPYLAIVRGRNADGMIPNLLDTFDLHWKLPAFCRSIAANPDLLLDPSFPLSQATLDGKPFLDNGVMIAARKHAETCPHIRKTIKDFFSGAAIGWEVFTSEFVKGGPLDSLTAEQRSMLYLPATNDHNEGGLGSWRVHARYHPNSNPSSFSGMARWARNNTEKFITKHCTMDDLIYVMRSVRSQDASGENAKFRKDFVEEQQRRAQANRDRLLESVKKRLELEDCLKAIGIEKDRTKILKMTVVDLKAQLDVYRHIVEDPVIKTFTLASIPNKMHKLYAVLAALTRYERCVPMSH